jgi:hypothetical protein
MSSQQQMHWSSTYIVTDQRNCHDISFLLATQGDGVRLLCGIFVMTGFISTALPFTEVE